MNLTTETKDALHFLLDDNDTIFYRIDNNLYDRVMERAAIKQYEENNKKIREILDIQDYGKVIKARIEAERLADIERNKDTVDNIISLMKDTFEDIKNPSVNRVYKLNLEKESRFDVYIELRNRTDIEGVYDPFANLKREPNTTREEWDRATEGHKKYFEEEYERLKTWYSEEIKEKVGHEWIPIDPKSEPQKTEFVLDEEIISMASGFMVGPVGLYNGRAVAAETHRYDNLAEMQIFLKGQAKNQDMVLYMTFKKDNAYFFRGAFVPKEKVELSTAV